MAIKIAWEPTDHNSSSFVPSNIPKRFASITYGYEKTVSTSTTQTINNNCANDQTGTLFWYPLFTQHHGGFGEGPSPVDIYVPVSEGDDGAVGKYQVVCSG
ncbi:hypothetical protein D6C84_09156 [Aureobasidium pullulans]|uniref:Uncharacterized protein n=1 Tax=Aureobasidium pullulans TaxID=5580 RepID=A0A4S9X989_AURPU|nr:hypothetical protein D6C84_09156 [Aureobasidium pullulans]